MSKQNIMTLHEAGKQILAAMDKWTPEEKAAFWAKLDKQLSSKQKEQQ